MTEMTIEQEMNFQREMQEKQQSGDPNAVYADSMREEKIKNVIAQLNPELLLNEIEHRIRGDKKIYAGGMEVGWERIDKQAEPISEILVQNYISLLNIYLTQNNSLSNFSTEEINNIMEVVIDHVRDDLSDNSYLYDLTSRKTIKVEKQAKLLVYAIDDKGITHIHYEPIMITQEIVVGEEHTDYNKFNRIGHIICQSTFSVLKQAQNGMLASRIFKALRVNETLNGGEKKGIIESLKFWK